MRLNETKVSVPGSAGSKHSINISQEDEAGGYLIFASFICPLEPEMHPSTTLLDGSQSHAGSTEKTGRGEGS